MLEGVLDELVEGRSLDRATLGNIVCEGILSAYQRRYPDIEMRAERCDEAPGVRVLAHKSIVSTVANPDVEISLKKARNIKSGVAVGDSVWVPMENGIGRIEIVHARQVIASLIRRLEAEAVYNEFKGREGDVVYGVVHKCATNGTAVMIDETLAFLPRSLSIPGEKCAVGFSVRALLKEVLPEPRGDNQLILDRSSEVFLQRLFELEVPEVFDRIVEIKKVVRTAGYKSKVVVVSGDRHIDPVGTCVGVGGSRIKPILKELSGEKIDVIAWSDSPEEMVRNALKPAKVDRVLIDDESGEATVWVAEDQRSLAIGRMGQNITLASRLVGCNINLARDESSQGEQPDIGDFPNNDERDPTDSGDEEVGSGS